MNNILLVFFTTLFISSFAPDTLAFRCDKEIVSRWDTSADTLTKCGNPFFKNYGYENVNGRSQYLEKWFYNCGEKDFIYSISILNGKIFSIESVKRGSGQSECRAPK
jgi:hypothetical protein